jgi:hypothetical protein
LRWKSSSDDVSAYDVMTLKNSNTLIRSNVAVVLCFQDITSAQLKGLRASSVHLGAFAASKIAARAADKWWSSLAPRPVTGLD